MMPLKPKIDFYADNRSDWRTSQRMFQRQRAGKKRLIRCGVLLVLAIISYGLVRGGSALFKRSAHIAANTAHSQLPDEPPVSPLDALSIKKADLQTEIVDVYFHNLRRKCFNSVLKGQDVKVETSLDIPLQQYLLDKLTGSISRRTAIVVMEPATGRVLAMVGFDEKYPEYNPCVDSSFPAASIFKIVTAAAAIEKAGLTPNSKLTFNGRKYTLYKSQLKNRNNRYTNRISLKDSFAQSINPVFGKIGSQQLGPKILAAYADAFGFNRPIDFEVNLTPSAFSITENPYQWAEIACGFNRDTTISPLHGAVMAAAIVNHGHMPNPFIVDHITNKAAEQLYRVRPDSMGQALTATTALKLSAMMQGTIRAGTCRKAFRGYRKDRVLSKLSIGGKTGSINNRARDARIDWFVGFAAEKNGPGAIALSVMVAHGKYIGTRAGDYARLAIKHYFRSYFSTRSTVQKTDAQG